MRYRYEDLSDEEFQQLVQALLTHAYGPDVRAMPLGKADGGRDVLHHSVVYQVKFTNSPDKVRDPVGWLLRALDGESDKILALVARGARAYCLVTNVAGSANLDTGAIDRLDAELSSRSSAWGIQLTRWWRGEVDAQVACAPSALIRSFTRILPPDHALVAAAAEILGGSHLLLPDSSGFSESREARNAGLRLRDPASHSRSFAAAHVVTASLEAPYARLPKTVRGREPEVDRLVNRSRQRVQVLSGMGGVGKTTIALEAADLAQHRGCRVFWINATSAAAVVESLQSVAVAAGVPEPTVAQAWSQPGRPAADLLWRSLASWNQPWMLVFDNADDLASLGCSGSALERVLPIM